jgi:mono/diheme cytochrome c family protein
LGALALILSAGIEAATPSAAADVLTGARLAGQWCASCHVVGDIPPASVQQGPPSFRTIAQGGLTTDQLRTFLSHPHAPMPDLALTRSEIDDLIAYIDTLRARDR